MSCEQFEVPDICSSLLAKLIQMTTLISAFHFYFVQISISNTMHERPFDVIIAINSLIKNIERDAVYLYICTWYVILGHNLYYKLNKTVYVGLVLL